MYDAEKVDLDPLRELVGDLADQHLSPTSLRFEGAYDVFVYELKRL